MGNKEGKLLNASIFNNKNFTTDEGGKGQTYTKYSMGMPNIGRWGDGRMNLGMGKGVRFKNNMPNTNDYFDLSGELGAQIPSDILQGAGLSPYLNADAEMMFGLGRNESLGLSGGYNSGNSPYGMRGGNLHLKGRKGRLEGSIGLDGIKPGTEMPTPKFGVSYNFRNGGIVENMNQIGAQKRAENQSIAQNRIGEFREWLKNRNQ